MCTVDYVHNYTHSITKNARGHRIIRGKMRAFCNSSWGKSVHIPPNQLQRARVMDNINIYSEAHARLQSKHVPCLACEAIHPYGQHHHNMNANMQRIFTRVKFRAMPPFGRRRYRPHMIVALPKNTVEHRNPLSRTTTANVTGLAHIGFVVNCITSRVPRFQILSINAADQKLYHNHREETA